MQKPDFIDIHSHLNFAAFAADRDEVVKRSLQAGVFMITVGTQKDTSLSALKLAEKYPAGVYATVGLHPIHTSRSFHDEKELGEGGQEFTSRGERFELETYRKLAEHPKVVAIGECGLDFYRVEPEKLEIQRQDFLAQIELANGVNKPLMLHVRDAYEEVAKILRAKPAKASGVVHCFTGTYEQAKLFLDLGFYISFAGVITFPPKKNPKAGELRSYDEVVRAVPLDRLLCDTDSPYLAPVPYRGKRNEPVYVKEVYKKIAELKRQPLEEVKETINASAMKLFSLTR